MLPGLEWSPEAALFASLDWSLAFACVLSELSLVFSEVARLFNALVTPLAVSATLVGEASVGDEELPETVELSELAVVVGATLLC